jgi:hypothetical protein
MDNKPKKEQIFVLLSLFIACFFLVAATGASGAPDSPSGAKRHLISCGSARGCWSCGKMTCGTIGCTPYWSYESAAGSSNCYVGCREVGYEKTGLWCKNNSRGCCSSHACSTGVTDCEEFGGTVNCKIIGCDGIGCAIGKFKDKDNDKGKWKGCLYNWPG